MSHVINFLFREFASFVTLAGRQFVIRDEKLTVELLITHLLKYWKELNMIIQLIYGVWEY